MEIRHLRYFLAVSEELSFAQAAKRVHIEPSPLARAIKQLEADLGVSLLRRNARHLELTAAGRIFQEQSHQVLAAMDEAKRRINCGQHSASEQPDDLKIAQLRKVFSEVIDQYLLSGSTPHPGGHYSVCLNHEVHKAADVQARRLKMSLSEWVNDVLSTYLKNDGVDK